MKTTVYLHVGPTQTGSTAIQHFLSSNDELLLKKGYQYVKALRDEAGAHNPLVYVLFHMLYGFVGPRAGQKYVQERDSLLKAFFSEIATSVSPSIIISSEAILFSSPKLVHALLNTISRVPQEIDIKGIVYIRAIARQFISNVAHSIKLRNTDTDDERLCSAVNRMADHLLGFRQGLDVFADRVGKDNLIFRKYGESYFEGGTIFSDILSALGLELTDEFTLPQHLVNNSLKSCETLYFKDVLNRLRLTTSEGTIVENLFEWESANRGTPFQFPADLRSQNEAAAAAHRLHMLDNYLTSDFEEVLNEGEGLLQEHAFDLSHKIFVEMLDYMDSRIEGFKCEYMHAISHALDSAYFSGLLNNKIEERLKTFTEGRRCAFWRCPEDTAMLLEWLDFSFLQEALLCVVDADVGKHSSLFLGHRIAPVRMIGEKDVDTVIIASPDYATETIIKEIRDNFPRVRSVVNLAKVVGNIEVTNLNR
ncbi:MAG: hypothetical protein GY847_21270 [Proteobacteria bacterium]|nr:hypothetical protein [Pseudomonadota bacterium]